MIDLQSMEEFKPYKNTKLFIATDAEDKDYKKGDILYLCTKSVNDSIDIINTNSFKGKQHFKSYYIDFRYKLKLFNKPINEKLQRASIYTQIGESSKNITKFYMKPDKYKGNNLYVDLYHYMELFFNKVEELGKSPEMVRMEFMSLLELAQSSVIELPEYNTKTFVIDLLQWGVPIHSSELYNRKTVNNPFSILYWVMKSDLEKFKKLDFDILLKNGNSYIKFIPKNATPEYPNMVKVAINKLSEVTRDDNVQQEEITSKETVTNIVKGEIKAEILDKLYDDNTEIVVPKHNFSGDVASDTSKPNIDKMLEEEVKKVATAIKDDKEITDITQKTMDNINENKELLEQLELAKMEKTTNISKSSLARNKILAEKQAKLKINNGMTIEEILKETKDKTFDTEVYNNVDVINEDMKHVKAVYMDREYNTKLMDKDAISIINSLKDLSIPAYVLDVKKEDTSDNFTKKYTWTVHLETEDRVRHTLKFDLPKMMEDSFMYIGGNKKVIVRQLMLKPVSKTGPDTVQLCSNYNKIFLTRSGDNISPKIERLKKYIPSKSKAVIINGNNEFSNLDYKTSIEYDELGKSFMTLKLKDTILIFNQKEIRSIINNENLDPKNKLSNVDLLPIGYNIVNGKKEILYYDLCTDSVEGTDISLADLLIDKLDKIDGGNVKEELNSINVGKKYIYTRATIMKKKVPLILLTSYLDGLSTVLRKADIKHYFSDTRPILKDADKNNKDVIEFADGYLIYDRYPMENSLLLNALYSIPTKEYNFTDFDGKEIYLDICNDLLGARMILNAFDNFKDLFIDAITKEVLEDLNLPTDFVELLIYANTLLADNAYIPENNLSLYRIRSNEIINAILYKKIADAYGAYRITAGNKNPQKISIPQDAVMKEIVTSNIVEDYSTLNPILESEKLRAVSFKGPSGV